ncbi:MAG: HAMP domain-containing protein, partial [Myxococcales bacterium]|nr:HAMP domain-containing protein [Myxococcales bacterium]
MPATPPAEPAEPAKVCRHFVPVIVSHHVVELYNGTLRRAHGFPQLNPDGVRGFTFDLIIGESMVSASNKDHVIHDRGMFVGFSDKAIPLGLTLPLGYVQRYNVEFGNEEDAQRYHSVVVEVPTKDHVAQVAKGVADLNLQVKDTGAEEAALLIAVFMMVFGLVSAVIVGIAAVNIMHVFFMLVYERQREIGQQRSSQADVEAAALQVVAGAGVLVLLVAIAAGALVARATTRKATELSRVMARVGEGDLAVRARARGRDELATLARAFNGMLDELAQAQARVAYLQRIGAWQGMARRIAHEIKNPLTPIQLAVQQLRDKDPGL